MEPIRVDRIQIDGKEHQASYFGEEDLSGFSPELKSRAFWGLENAYEDFKDNVKTGNVPPYNNYPMQIQEGQIFVIDDTKADDSVEREYYRSDGNAWQGSPAAEEFRVQE